MSAEPESALPAGPFAYRPATWRLIDSGAAGGALNMANDEAILLAVAAGRAPATLRLYAWDPPCLSLGYAQPAGEVDRARLAERGWDLVRRPTGGRAILHADELTYAVIVPEDDPRVQGGVLESYQRLSEALVAALHTLGLRPERARPAAAAQRAVAERAIAGRAVAGHAAGGQELAWPGPAERGGLAERGGPERGTAGAACFDGPGHYEITFGGAKLIGSAQMRRQGVVLQHGTLPLHGDITRIVAALALRGPGERRALEARLHFRATTLFQALGRAVDYAEAAAALTAGFARALAVQLEPGTLRPAEAADAARLCAEKYAAESWTNKIV